MERSAQEELKAHLMKTDLGALNQEKIGALHGRIFRSVDGLIRFVRISFLDFFPAILTGLFALVTTAVGLFVAIPAVWAFNYFTNKVEAFDVEMDNSSSELIDYFLKQSRR